MQMKRCNTGRNLGQILKNKNMKVFRMFSQRLLLVNKRQLSRIQLKLSSLRLNKSQKLVLNKKNRCLQYVIVKQIQLMKEACYSALKRVFKN